MDHETYENEMMAVVNRHGEVATEESSKTAKAKWSSVINKNDTKVVVTGLKRTLLAFATLAMLAVAVFGFITVAKAQGYIAVVIFFASIIALIASYTLLYAQGIISKATSKSGGEENE